MNSTGIPLNIELMRQQPLFSRLDEDGLQALARGSWMIHHPRATRIISRGDHLDGLFAVIEGRLKLYMLSCNGDERVLRVLQAGDSFGEAIMFNAIPSPVYVDTLVPATLGFFPREIISDALARNSEFVQAMLRGMSGLMRELIQDLEACCLQSALQRTVAYLLREADAAPEPHIEIRLPAPKAVVASTLNVSAETFSRELHRLQKLGMIEISRRTIYLRDRERLWALVDGRQEQDSRH